jgi:hypothetical protein
MNIDRGQQMKSRNATRATRIISLLFGFAAFVDLSAPVFAQQTHVWSDVDCTQSKIVVPAGFKCRATQEYYGGQGTAFSGAGGMFREWTASATLNNVRLFYLLHEGIAGRSNVVTTEPLEERIKQLSRKADKNFSPPRRWLAATMSGTRAPWDSLVSEFGSTVPRWVLGSNGS